jgi:hypothetical protein
MPTQRCTSDNCSGTRCLGKTKFGEYCWRHLPLHQSVKIKLFKGLGRGLIADKDFKRGDFIAVYNGDIYTTDSEHPPDYPSNYVLQLSKGVRIDASRTNTSVGRLINDPRGTGFKANACFVADQKKRTVWIKATKGVKKGDQFFIDYGHAYWESLTDDTTQKKKSILEISPSIVGSSVIPNTSPPNLTKVIHPETLKLGDPSSLTEILTRPDKDHWHAARLVEHNNHIDNKTYIVINRDQVPSFEKLLRWREVYKVKMNSKGEPELYKARFTIQGCGQTPDQYGEIVAYVFMLRSLRVLCALVALKDLEFKQLDFTAAYLQSDLKEDIFAVPPKGLNLGNDKAIKLIKSIYGLKQSGHNWQEKLFTQLIKMKYKALTYIDKCIFTRESKSKKLFILAVYVDDMGYVYDKVDSNEMDADIKTLTDTFKLTLMGDSHYMLGWRIIRDRSKRTLSLDMQGYITQSLEEFGLNQCKSVVEPGTHNTILYPIDKLDKTKLIIKETEFKSNEFVEEDKYPTLKLNDYRKYIGILLWISHLQPGILNATSQVAQFSNDPQPHHLKAVNKIFRYLSGVKEQKLIYDGNKINADTIISYSDSDWSGNPMNSKSTSGFAIFFCGGLVSFYSKRQKVVAGSTLHAETIAATELLKELIWVQALLGGLGCPQPSPLVVFMDNQPAISVAKGGGSFDLTKHIRIRHHQLEEAVTTKFVNLKYIKTDDNLADIFTKALPGKRFNELIQSVMGNNNKLSQIDISQILIN